MPRIVHTDVYEVQSAPGVTERLVDVTFDDGSVQKEMPEAEYEAMVRADGDGTPKLAADAEDYQQPGGTPPVADDGADHVQHDDNNGE